jgi:hypothetical protein
LDDLPQIILKRVAMVRSGFGMAFFDCSLRYAGAKSNSMGLDECSWACLDALVTLEPGFVILYRAG